MTIIAGSTTESDARKILKQNYRCEEGSFIYCLHENGKFDKKSFWEYYDCICELGKKPHSEKFDQQLLIEVTHTYEFILKCILYHFAPNDIYRIKFFPRIKYIYYIERLDFSIEAFFKDLNIDKVSFGDYIKLHRVIKISVVAEKGNFDNVAVLCRVCNLQIGKFEFVEGNRAYF